MNIKEEIINGIKNKKINNDIIMMYRGNLDTDISLHDHFGLGKIETDWKKLLKMLGADMMSTGHTLSRYFTYFPEYKKTGPYHKLFNDPGLFYSWGLNSKKVYTSYGEYINYAINKPLKDASLEEVINYRGPEVTDFNFDNFNFNMSDRIENFFCTGVLNDIYIIAAWLRGEDQFLMDLASNTRLARILIDKVAEFTIALSNEIYNKHGNKLDMFGIWDDVATQDSMVMRPDIWRRFFKKWYKRLIEDAKKYDQVVLFHCCGNPDEIIPDLIDIGVDILDPIQTSAKNMSLDRLHRLYHKDLCFHGGVDVQKLLPHGTINEVVNEVKRSKDIFADGGFILLGPSHQIPIDIPIENIIAIYR